MAIVRELTTVLDFKVDKSGFNQFEAAINQVKSSLISLGKIFGVVFAADKLFEVVDGIFKAGKEVNKLTYQIGQLARSGDDAAAATEGVFEIAQKTGVAYTDVLDTYKEFLNESKESEVSQTQLLHTVENIFTSMKLFASSAEQMKEVTRAFNLGFRRGAIGIRQWGLIVDEAPKIADAIVSANNLGEHGREILQQMAKDGKLTADFIVKSLGRSIDSLDRQWENRPLKLADALTFAWNAAVKLSARIQKLLGMTTFMAKEFLAASKWVISQVERISDKLGGLAKTLETIGWLVAITLTPALLKLFQIIAIGTARWLARNLLIIASYLAMAVAVAGIFLAIEDISVWMRGGKSVLGDFLGPFDKFMEDFNKLFDESAVMAPFKAFKLFLEGDFVTAWEKVKQAMGDTIGQIGLIIIALGIGWIGFRLWNTLRFFGLIDALTGVVKVLALISSGALEAVAAMIRLAKIKTLMMLGPVGMAAVAAMSAWEALTSGKEGTIVKPADTNIAPPPLTYPDNGRSWLMDQIKGGLGWIKSFGPGIVTPQITPGQITPGVGATAAPGATVQNNIGIGGDQKNNIVIQIDPTLQIAEMLRNTMEDVLDKIMRDARNASPLLETSHQ